MKLFLAALVLATNLTSAFAGLDGKVTCSGSVTVNNKKKIVKVVSSYNGYGMSIEDSILSVTVDGKKADVGYDQLTNLYVSPSDYRQSNPTIILFLQNDGTETVLAAEYFGGNNPKNKISISGRLVGSAEYLATLREVSCKAVVEENID